MGFCPAMERLGRTTLPDLPATVRRPRYDRSTLRPRLVHVGVGAFHRCHQAEYLDDLATDDASDWGIVGVNLSAPDILPELAAQDGLYTRVLRDAAVDDARVIGSIIETVPAGDPNAAVEAMASAEVDMISLTVTEKGYCHVPATGEPDPDHVDLAHDLGRGVDEAPRTMPGAVVAALERRHDAGGGEISLVSCDNVPENGRVLERVIRHVAEHRAPQLLSWIDDDVGFVETMVDRIVPATPDDESDRLAGVLGVRDAVPVVGEPFRQWVLADSFRGPRPAFERAGAQITDDVAAYETLKMRVVNGAQSMLALLGALGGITYISAAVGDRHLRLLVERQLVEEVVPHLPPVELDVDDYCRTLLGRLVNPAIRHTTHQIATDSSRKIVPRFVRPFAAARRVGRPTPVLALGIAAYMRYQLGVDDVGRAFRVVDPAAATVRGLIERAGPGTTQMVAAVLSYEPIFGELEADAGAIEMIASAFDALGERGVAVTTSELLAGVGAER